MRHHAHSAGGMDDRKRLFLRRMEALFVATRFRRRIRHQIPFERTFHIRREAMICKPPRKMRPGKNFPVPVAGKARPVDFDAQSAKISDYFAVAFVPALQHPAEELFQPGIIRIYSKTEQMEFVETFARVYAEFDPRY